MRGVEGIDWVYQCTSPQPAATTAAWSNPHPSSPDLAISLQFLLIISRPPLADSGRSISCCAARSERRDSALIAALVVLPAAESGFRVLGRPGRADESLGGGLEEIRLASWQGGVGQVRPCCWGVSVLPLSLLDVLSSYVQMLPLHFLECRVFLVFDVPPRLRYDEVVELLSQLIETDWASVFPQIRDF